MLKVVGYWLINGQHVVRVMAGSQKHALIYGSTKDEAHRRAEAYITAIKQTGDTK